MPTAEPRTSMRVAPRRLAGTGQSEQNWHAATVRGLEQLARIRPRPSHAAQLVIRGLLDHPGIDDALARALTHPDLHTPALEVARHQVQQTVDAGEPWPAQAAHWLSRANADWTTSAAFCNEIAWYARTRHNSATTYLAGTNRLLHAGTDRTYARALAHLQLVSLRYDFRTHSIQKLLDQVPEHQRDQWDPYTRSLRAFALLGQPDPAGLPAMQLSLDEAGDNPQVCHALLHGLWLGTDLPGQAEHILRLAARPVFDPSDPVMLLRTAGALRTLGRKREALAAVDEAMEALDPNAPEFHADLVRERSLITMLPQATAQSLAPLPTTPAKDRQF